MCMVAVGTSGGLCELAFPCKHLNDVRFLDDFSIETLSFLILQ